MEGLGVSYVMGVCLLFFLVWTVGVFGTKPRRFYRVWRGVPALGLATLIVVLSVMRFYHTLPSVVFQDSVGFAPPADVTIENSLRHKPTDWDDSFLEFYASDSTIERILRNGFVSIPPADIIEYSDAPAWWAPPQGEHVRTYATNTYDPKFHDEDLRFFVSHRLLIYDPGSGQPEKRRVYFRYRRP